jgi:hypothetical protein
MAGSYNHVVNDNGTLASNKWIAGMVENGGDMYETIEEMYGMIWELAASIDPIDPAPHVERARQQYKTGLAISKHHARPKR